jgi:hypothetical protein
VRFNLDTRQIRQATQELADKARFEMEREVIKAIRAGGADIQADAVRSIQSSPPLGRMRASGDPASAPGLPPRTDTGRLASSGRVEPTPQGANVVFPVSYAVHLEYGTSRIQPRPFLGPAAERQAPRLVQRVQAAVARSTR